MRCVESMKEEVALARGNIYKMLSMALGYPGDDFQVSLLDDSFLRHLTEGAKELPGYRMEDQLKSLRTAIEKYGNRIFEDIASEYHALFGNGQSSMCPPYELGYLRGPLFMNTGELADIAGFYKAFGLEAADGNKDRLDHMSIELEFMHFLALKEVFALRNGKRRELAMCRDAQKKFLRDHLGRWTYVFSRRIKMNDSDFYYRLGRLLDKFVSSDLKALRVKVEKLKDEKFELDNAHEEEQFSCGSGVGSVNKLTAKGG